jgi:predicted nucleic acid-binding protein
MPPPLTLSASVLMWMRGLIRTLSLVPDRRPARGILDTSVVLDLEHIEPSRLPVEVAVSAITMAELAAGPHATPDPEERARRQDRLQRAEAAFDPLPFDAEAARAYGRIYAAVTATGRKARGARAVDLLLAAVACAAGLPLYTRNPDDFRAIGDLVEVVAV